MTNVEKAGLMMHGTFVLNADNSRLVFEGDAKLMAQDNNYVQKLSEQTGLGIPVSIFTDPRNHFNAALGTSVSSGDFSKWTEPLNILDIVLLTVTYRTPISFKN